MKHIMLLAFLAVLTTPLAAEDWHYLEADLDKMTPLEYNSWASIPPRLIERFKKSQLHKSHELVYDLVNPFYLAGDFDGDQSMDFAVWLCLKGKDPNPSAQIAVFSGDEKVRWLHQDIAGTTVLPGPAWWVVSKADTVESRPDLNEGPAPKRVGDGFMLARPESSRALVYWNGSRFDFYWQSD